MVLAHIIHLPYRPARADWITMYGRALGPVVENGGELECKQISRWFHCD